MTKYCLIFPDIGHHSSWYRRC